MVVYGSHALSAAVGVSVFLCVHKLTVFVSSESERTWRREVKRRSRVETGGNCRCLNR